MIKMMEDVSERKNQARHEVLGSVKIVSQIQF